MFRKQIKYYVVRSKLNFIDAPNQDTSAQGPSSVCIRVSAVTPRVPVSFLELAGFTPQAVPVQYRPLTP